MTDKSITIKYATDEQLSALLQRLRAENEVQNLIREIQIKSKPNPEGPYPQYGSPNYEGISTEKPVDSMYHFGMPGRSGRYPFGSGKNPSIPQLKIKQKTYEVGATTAKEYANIAALRGRKKEEYLSNMKRREAKMLTDEELKGLVSRLNMEQQYRNLTTKDVDVGKNRLMDTLTVVGSMMTIAAAGAGLALTVRELSAKTKAVT